MARFRSFADAVAYYEAEQGLTRKRAVARALKRCPSLVRRMAKDVVAQAEIDSQQYAEATERAERIADMLTHMREEAAQANLDNALAMIKAEKARRVREGTMS